MMLKINKEKAKMEILCQKELTQQLMSHDYNGMISLWFIYTQGQGDGEREMDNIFIKLVY